jgi:hypothetical protein
MVPQVYYFPEFVVWCIENYFPSKRAIISTIGFVLVELNTQTINEMMRCPLNLDSDPLYELVEDKCFKELESKDRVSMLQSYLCTNRDALDDISSLQTNIFPETL